MREVHGGGEARVYMLGSRESVSAARVRYSVRCEGANGGVMMSLSTVAWGVGGCTCWETGE